MRRLLLPSYLFQSVSCSSDMTIKVWDSNDDWKNTKTLYGHDHSVSAVKFMPGDDFVVSAGRDRSIRVWDIKTGRVF